MRRRVPPSTGPAGGVSATRLTLRREGGGGGDSESVSARARHGLSEFAPGGAPAAAAASARVSAPVVFKLEPRRALDRAPFAAAGGG